MSGVLQLIGRLPARKNDSGKTITSPRTAMGRRILAFYRVTSMRPSTQQLSGYADMRTPDYIVTGNPSLRNEIYHSASILYNGKITFPSLSYRFSDNRIAKYWYRDESGRMVESFTNGGKYREAMMSFQNNFTLGKNVRLLGEFFASYKKDVVGDYSSEGFSLNVTVAPMVTVWREYLTARLLLIYFNNWMSGYNSWSTNPFDCRFSLSGRASISKGVSVSYGVNTGNLLYIAGRRTTNRVVAESFIYRETLRTGLFPVSCYSEFSFGTFKAKTPRTTRHSSELGGFSRGEAPL